MTKSKINIIFMGLTALLSLCPALAINIQTWQVGEAKVFFVETSDLPLVDIDLSFLSGSADDPQTQAGLARFTQSQLMLGNRLWTEKKLADRKADFGVIMSGGVDSDYSRFRLRLVKDSETLKEIIPLWLNLLSQPYFQKKLFDRERDRAIADYRESLTQPAPVASQHFFPRVYGKHPYGFQANEKTYRNINIDDLKRFYQQHYHQGNARLTLVGSIDRETAESLSRTIIHALAKAPEHKTNSTRISWPVAEPIQGRVDIPFSSQQTHILIGLPFINRQDPDLFPLLVGNYILGGGGFESRLMKVVRVENGLAYSVYSTFNPLRDRGAWLINVQTRNDQAEKSLALLEKTVMTFLREGPTQDELARAQEFMVNNFPLRLDTHLKILDQVATIGRYDLPLDYLDTWMDKVKQVSRQDIIDAFSRKINVGQWAIVTVGTPTQPNSSLPSLPSSPQ